MSCCQEDIFFNMGADVILCWRSCSGYAEVYSAMCGLSRLVGVSNVMQEMRSECCRDPMEHAVDACTCKSIPFRRRPGGIKYFDTKQLWVQESVTEERIRVIEFQPRGASRRHTGVVLKRQGHAETRQDDGLRGWLALHLPQVSLLVLSPSCVCLLKTSSV